MKTIGTGQKSKGKIGMILLQVSIILMVRIYLNKQIERSGVSDIHMITILTTRTDYLVNNAMGYTGQKLTVQIQTIEI
jgi:hypothetical protein